MRLAWLSVVMCCAVACETRQVELAPNLARRAGDATSGDSAPVIPGLLALRITPGAVAVTFDGADLSEVPVFSAIGSFAEGERDVTQQVAWSLGRPSLGTLPSGRFVTAAVGGESSVLARAGAVSARADLRVELDIVLDRAGLADSERARFGAQAVLDPALQISYPAHGTSVPSNLAYLRTQWRAPAELDRFELRVDGPYSHLRYYTDQRSWLDDADSSRYLAPSHAGGSVEISVRAFASAAPEQVYQSAPLSLQIVDLASDGGVYYWSTTARGVKRGHLAADTAQLVAAADPGPERCAGCHALSRDGSRLAVSNQMQRLGLLSLPDQLAVGLEAMPMPAPEIAPAPPGMAMPTPAKGMPPKQEPKPRDGPDFGWGTFNPAGTRLLYADKGKLRLIDVATGREVGKLELPPGAAATHPDWAPDGRAVAVTYWPDGKKVDNKQVQGTSIARLPVLDDGTLAAPEVIVASTGPDDTLYQPSYAPDGRWLAFVRASGSGKDNPSARIYLMAADGTGVPSELPALNRAESDAVSNRMPTWLPGLTEGVGFLVFSSTRDYGDQLVGAQRDQLWAAAIDFDQLALDADRSAPAFWLPFQDPLEHNHRALWSTQASDRCPSSSEQCNGRDDDCDTRVDEDCCTPAPELCGDGIDNDCDGVADEGCGCASVETCDNQLDDDCDQVVDEDCKE